MPTHPWRTLRARPHIDLAWARLAGRLGQTDGHSTIVLHPDQSQVQRRCTLAHELAHIDLGHVDGADAVQEQEARALAAHRLVPMWRLLDALAWSGDLAKVAADCWVDLPTLMGRLDGLNGEERAQIVALYRGGRG